MSRISIFMLACLVATTAACPCGDGCGGPLGPESTEAQLVLTPEEVRFEAQAGGAHSGAKQVSVTAPNGGSVSGLRFLETYPGSGVASYWLKVSLSGESTPAVLLIEPATTNLPVGTHQATIYVQVGPTGYPHKVKVTMVVRPSS